MYTYMHTSMYTYMSICLYVYISIQTLGNQARRNGVRAEEKLSPRFKRLLTYRHIDSMYVYVYV